MDYCKACAQALFDGWESVPWQDLKKWHPLERSKFPILPKLPMLEAGSCPSCHCTEPLNSCTEPLNSDHIGYLNIGPGLPDHWELVIRDTPDKADELAWMLNRFGHPYPDDFDDQQSRR